MKTVVIVDDEPPARRKLARLLEAHAEFRLVGEAASVDAAAAVIEERRPDLVLLDVRITGGTGFDVLAKLGPETAPLPIFVTAHGEFAVEAFAVRALDYLLKPVSAARFAAAMERAAKQLRADPGYLRRILIREEGITYFVEAGAVDWMESARNYVVLHAGERTHIVRGTLEGVLERLDPAQFTRLSRSAAVNVARLRAVADGWAILAGGTRVKASPRWISGLKSAHWV